MHQKTLRSHLKNGLRVFRGRLCPPLNGMVVNFEMASKKNVLATWVLVCAERLLIRSHVAAI